MKSILSALLIFAFVFISNAQSVEMLDSWRVKTTRKNMAVLGGWALLNIGGGIAGMSATKGSTYYFHQMNVGWNAVNLGIALAGYFFTQPAKEIDSYLVVKKLSSMENSLMLNTGLDFAYITAGIALTELARNQSIRAEQFRGFGQSLILQGAFLAVFDIYQFVVIANKKNLFLKENFSVLITPAFSSIVYKF